MASKTYSVGFYTGMHGDQNYPEDISTCLRCWSSEHQPPAVTIGSYKYKIKNLVGSQGNLIQGVFAKFRHDDLPNIGGSDDTERPIELDDEEGLIEKNHFLYDCSREVLVFQQNGHGSTVGQFAEYITQAKDVTSVFNPIIQPDAMRRLLSGNTKPVQIELSVAAPENPALMKQTAFTKNLIKTMSESGARTINLKMSIGRTRNDYLKMDVVQGVAELFNHTPVKVARFKMEDSDGVNHLIDLVTDRIKASIIVDMQGRYPNSENIFSKLAEVRREHAASIVEVVG